MSRYILPSRCSELYRLQRRNGGASLGKHVGEWKPEDEDYVTAHEQRRLHAEEPIRTQDEQESDLYSARTTCSFFGSKEEMSWDLGRCRVVNRLQLSCDLTMSRRSTGSRGSCSLRL
jgi:hypothetical protein